MRAQCALIFFIFCSAAFSGEEVPPIYTAKSPVGELLRKWFAEGTAAGNIGDWYDNRDRTHSELDRRNFPQLQKHVYSEEELKFRRDWAARGTVLPKVAFGNSSTSAPVTLTGSNPRMMYTNPKGLPALYEQFTKNNLYIYPEHQDHDPGHNGVPANGYGDMYPANSPYLIVSQGSSGSDQPFMRAIPLTLAAFRPEVKKKLIESGLLMPTVQMIFRTSNKQLKDPKDYLTGLAHPPVFEGSWVDELKMVEAAHAIQAGDIPPMVKIKALEEDKAVAGVDYFEDDETEKHADTPYVISRFFRGSAQTRRMVVSAEESHDLNQRPLTFHWSVLRGDASRIKINYLNDAHSKAELIVPFHARRTDEHDSKIETNRIDIGIFANNGAHYSAPAFVTWFCFDNEARTYDAQGHVTEIGYGFGETTFNVTDWPGLLELIADGSRLFAQDFPEDTRAALKRAAQDYRTEQAALTGAQQKRKERESARNKINEVLKLAEAPKSTDAPVAAIREAKKKLESDFQFAERAQRAAESVLNDVIAQKREGFPLPLQALMDAALTRLKQKSTLAEELKSHAGDDKNFANALASTRKLLGNLGIPKEPVTIYEKAMFERANGSLLAAALPKLINIQFRVNFVDPQLTAPKRWRDVYHYDAKGNLTGWTRFDEISGASEFTWDGFRVLEKDALGRCTKAQAVKYVREVDMKKGFNELWKPLKQVLVEKFNFYAYENDDDRRGKVARTETPEKPK